MQYYLGVDIGTTSAKAVAFSLTGDVITSCFFPYKMYHLQPNWSEQDPKEVFDAVIESCNKVISSIKGTAPEFIAFSSAMHSIIAIDKDGAPLTNCIIWADNRATEIAENLKNSELGKSFYHAAGVPVHPMSPLCKLLWLKENEPDIFKKAWKFIGIKEYIFQKLAGEYLVDTSIASATGLLNLKMLNWDENILGFVNIGASSLSGLVSPKYKTVSVRNQIEVNAGLIPPGTTLIIGGSDGALANLAEGSADGDSMVISIGTSGAARLVTDKVETDSQMRTFCYHIKDNLYVIGGPSNNGAIVLEWLKEKLLETTETFSELFLKAGTVKAGSDNLLFLPYILGERAPVWNSNARGVFFGLDITHTKSHLVRACMEGVIYSMFSIGKILMEKRVITKIHATGGFAQSPLWLQMLADVCNIKVLVSGAVESSALGAVMIGLEATGREPFPAKKTLSSFVPNSFSQDIYSKNFEKFERIFQLVKEEWATPQMPQLSSLQMPIEILT